MYYTKKYLYKWKYSQIKSWRDDLPHAYQCTMGMFNVHIKKGQNFFFFI